jgi:serine/threonine-protein kinase HipA
VKKWDSIGSVGIDLDFGGGTNPYRIGEIATGDRRLLLGFSSEFVDRGINPSPLRLKLTTQLQEGVSSLNGLPGLLHDSLPDGWAKLILDRAIRAAGYDHTSLTALDRLALVGKSGQGALSYNGLTLQKFSPPDVDFDTAAALVSKAPDESAPDRINKALTLAGSLGGARPKANIWMKDGAFSTAETEGASCWIAKFPALEDGSHSGAVEYAYSLMARAAGIQMPQTVLLESKQTSGYFAVERFDRTADGQRLHMHSFGGLIHAASSNTSLSYQDLMMVTGLLTQKDGNDKSSIEQQIARMAFNVFTRNRDDHVKNHAFLMDAEGKWSVSPAFDLTYANKQEHTLLVGKNGSNPSLEDMLEVARHVNFSEGKAREVISNVRDVVAEWKNYAKQANVDTAVTNEIDSSLNAISGNKNSARSAFFGWRSGQSI